MYYARLTRLLCRLLLLLLSTIYYIINMNAIGFYMKINVQTQYELYTI